MSEWQPLSRRSLISSYASTSSVKIAPAASHLGRPAAKRSSRTHIENASAGTGQASCSPRMLWTSARVASVGAGTIRSTIALGKLTDWDSQVSSCGEAPAACRYCSTRPPVIVPADCRLSQDSTVTGAPPSAWRLASPRHTRPIGVLGSSAFARSWAIGSDSTSSSPVRASRW